MDSLLFFLSITVGHVVVKIVQFFFFFVELDFLQFDFDIFYRHLKSFYFSLSSSRFTGCTRLGFVLSLIQNLGLFEEGKI